MAARTQVHLLTYLLTLALALRAKIAGSAQGLCSSETVLL